MTVDPSTPLVVGAGPVGLTMASELARHGVQCRIIDRAAQRAPTSRALGIFPRTLELFSIMGAADKFIAAGHRLQGLSIHHGDNRLAKVDITSVASPYPFILSLPQAETERLLIEQLSTFGIEVERATTLSTLQQSDETVRATLKHDDGREEVVETPWLLGCDGAHSATRHALGMEFAGAQYDESFILADLRIGESIDPDRVHLYLGTDGILGLFPFGGIAGESLQVFRRTRAINHSLS